ncbi:glycosyltransferase family 4 protein [Pseudonocardia sp. T1-2H]|uniref:glycosyltransferase family 4 protein n=1 Tax=Pseudonocardia sp. T1-2H TaxID=3128899 RepID=UPI003100FA59
MVPLVAAQSFGLGLPIREYLLAGLTAAVVTFLLTGLVRVLALKLGAVAWPRGRDVHVTPTPRWGGLAMLGGVLGGIGLAAQLPALRLAFDYSTDVQGVLLAALLIVAVGALDDRFELDALTKFAGQITAAGVLILFGVQWSVFWIPWGGGGSGISGSLLVLGPEQGVLLTVLITVALVNAMNFVDGLDGLAAGLGLISAAATGVFAIGLVQQNGNDATAYPPALLASVLAGACLGFLPHNFNPARIFMGDSGSMLIGLMLAAVTTSASGKLAISTTTDGTDILALLAPVIVLAAVVFVPLLDLLMAVVRRTRAGMSPFAPDKMHLHHRLLEIGHSHRRAVLLIYLWAAVLAFGAVALALIDDPFFVLWAVAVGLGVAVLASLVPRARNRTRTPPPSPLPPSPLPPGPLSGPGPESRR